MPHADQQHHPTRRRVCLLTAGAGLAQTLSALASQVTARQIIGRLQAKVEVEWRSPTVDTFKAGDPESIVKGIATTFTPTLDVLRRAAAAGRNLIITHEPTFYVHEDTTAFAGTAMYREKQAFIEQNGLVVFRFHDHIHLRKPDLILQGLLEMLAWQRQQTEDPRVVALPAAPLSKIAAHVQSSLKAQSLKVVGDPKLQITRVAVMPGAASIQNITRAIDGGQVQLVLIGETSEWQGMEYVRDAVLSGRKVAILQAGHVATEEPGMKSCADWMKTFVPEVPVEFIPARQPFL